MEMVALHIYVPTGNARVQGCWPGHRGTGQVGTLCSPHLSGTFLAGSYPPPARGLQTAEGEASLTQAAWGRGREEATSPGLLFRPQPAEFPDTQPWAARPSSSLLFSNFFTLCPELSLLPSGQ